MPKYTSPFYGDFEINTPEEAYRTVMDFCGRYCSKGGIEQFHCSGRDAAICDNIKKQICRDFNRKQGKKRNEHRKKPHILRSFVNDELRNHALLV